jgi:hypothetical protein
MPIKELHYMKSPKCGMNLVEIGYRIPSSVRRSKGPR